MNGQKRKEKTGKKEKEIISQKNKKSRMPKTSIMELRKDCEEDNAGYYIHMFTRIQKLISLFMFLEDYYVLALRIYQKIKK